MTCEAIIFDLDGTLLDTLADIGIAANGALVRCGCPPHGLDAYRYLVGEGVATLFERALPPDRVDPQTVQQCIAAFREEYARQWNIQTRLYPGIGELLDGLSRRALPLGVLSNKPDEFTQRCVQHYLSRWKFGAVFGQREGVPRKPDPAAAKEIVALLHATPQQCIYVGDTAVDMHTARHAGMLPVGVLWGFRPRTELENAGAHHLIEHPLQLLSLLADLPSLA